MKMVISLITTLRRKTYDRNRVNICSISRNHIYIRRSNPQKGGLMLDLENLIYAIDQALDTRRKRHIVGGILLSVSCLFGGLALTTLTIRKDEEDE